MCMFVDGRTGVDTTHHNVRLVEMCLSRSAIFSFLWQNVKFLQSEKVKEIKLYIIVPVELEIKIIFVPIKIFGFVQIKQLLDHAIGIVDIYEILFAICYHFYHLKNVKNTHGGLSLLVKLQAKESLQLY